MTGIFDLRQAARLAIDLLDLTSLNEDDSEQRVIDLCRAARTPAGDTAAVCIYPPFIPIARRTLQEQGSGGIRIATVANFPRGGEAIDSTVAEPAPLWSGAPTRWTWCSPTGH